MVDCFRFTSPFTDCQVTRTKRHVPLFPMTSPTWCCLRRRQRLLWLTYPLLRPKQEGLYPSQMAACHRRTEKEAGQSPSSMAFPKGQFQSYLSYPGTVPSWSSSHVRYFRTVASSFSSEFVGQGIFSKDFPTTHKIPFTMPQRWVLHVSSPLMLWDITLVNDLIQRATSMALAAHLIAHDAGVTLSELSPIFTCSASTRFWSLR